MRQSSEHLSSYPLQKRINAVPEYEVKRDPRWKEVWDTANDPRLYAVLRTQWERVGFDQHHEQEMQWQAHTMPGNAKIRKLNAATGPRSFEVRVQQHAQPRENMPVGGITLEIPLYGHDQGPRKLLLHVVYRKEEIEPLYVPGTRQVAEYGRRAGLAIEVEVEPKISPDNMVFYSLADLIKFLKRPDALQMMALAA